MKRIPIGKKFLYKVENEVFLLRARDGSHDDISQSLCNGCGMLNENCGQLEDIDCRGESTGCTTTFTILKHKCYAK